MLGTILDSTNKAVGKQMRPGSLIADTVLRGEAGHGDMHSVKREALGCGGVKERVGGRADKMLEWKGELF